MSATHRGASRDPQALPAGEPPAGRTGEPPAGRAGEPPAVPARFSVRAFLLRLLTLAVFIGVIAAAVGSLPGLGELRERFAHATLWLLLLIPLLKLGSCLSNIVAFRDVFCRRMSWRFSYELGMTEQGANVLIPTGGAGGLALGAWALHQQGMPNDHIGRRSVAFFVLTSIPNFAFAAVLGPLLLAGVLHSGAPAGSSAAFSALAWLVAVIVVALPWLLDRIDDSRPTGRVMTTVRHALVVASGGLHDTAALIAGRRWRAILGALGYLCFDIAALLLAFRAVHGSMPLGALVFAYVVGQLGGLIPVPGGVGGTDGGLIAALVLYGSSLPTAAAAVLAYRACQLGVPAILGSVAFVSLRRTLSRTHDLAAVCEPLAAEPEAAGDAALTTSD